LFGVVGLVLGLGAVGFLWMRTAARESDLNDRLRQAVQDSTRNAGVVNELRAATAQRDSVERQLGIIRAIDGDRYVWAHMLDEISEALPPYTWLTNIQQTSPVMPVAILDSLSRMAAGQNQDVASLVAADPAYRLRVRVIGQTVDFQALTRFMRVLEGSPFVEGVTLVGSILRAIDGYQVTEFTLDMMAQVPDSTAIRRVPLSIAVR
jgi:Tfp pilus assembly protein PilN